RRSRNRRRRALPAPGRGHGGGRRSRSRRARGGRTDCKARGPGPPRLRAGAADPAPGPGRVTERFGLVAAVANTVPPALTGTDLAKWRDHGGIVDVRQLSVRHGALIAGGGGKPAADARE